MKLDKINLYITEYEVKLTLTRSILGTVPKNKEVYAQYIATKAALTDEEVAKELENIENIEESGWTGFLTQDGKPYLPAYMIKGFFKAACGTMRRVKGAGSSKIRAYKKIIDGQVFVEPDELFLTLPEGEVMGISERPLRASTAQGERVTLARSDTCPAGTTLQFKIAILGNDVTEELLHEWLDYGKLRGLGQWRNSGRGSFEYEMMLVK